MEPIVQSFNNDPTITFIIRLIALAGIIKLILWFLKKLKNNPKLLLIPVILVFSPLPVLGLFSGGTFLGGILAGILKEIFHADVILQIQ